MLIQLGVWGWLAGTTMEREGLPNAGLYDQRAVLQWIQDFVGLVGGDKTQVSAWGESAGASSILQHLTAFGGAQDPLFSRAILQSPASPFSFDRKGNLERAFQTFASQVGCAEKGLACLRAASVETLKAANNQSNYALLPSADGKYIRQAAILELASGTYRSAHPIFLSVFSPTFRRIAIKSDPKPDSRAFSHHLPPDGLNESFAVRDICQTSSPLCNRASENLRTMRSRLTFRALALSRSRRKLLETP